jgi:hypothetical protein
MKDLIKNKYFYIGAIVSAFLTCLVSFITINTPGNINPAVKRFESDPLLFKSEEYVKEIEFVCALQPNQEYLLSGLVGPNMEILTRVKMHNSWTREYRHQLIEKVRISLIRGASQLSLLPLTVSDKGKII